MQQLVTTYYGYKILSKDSFEFYHVLLKKVTLKEILLNIKGVIEVSKKTDGTLRIKAQDPAAAINNLIRFFENKEQHFLETPDQKFVFDEYSYHILKEWAIAYQTCIALILTGDPTLLPSYNQEWSLLDSKAGGIYIKPFTIMFFNNCAKVIHPVSLANYNSRKQIEERIAKYTNNMINIFKKQKRTQIGESLIAYTQALTGLNKNIIVKIINNQSEKLNGPSIKVFLS